MQMAARIVLVGELFVVLFAALVARALSGVNGWIVLGVAVGTVVLSVAAAGLIQHRIGLILGSAVQVLLLGSTIWVHLMGLVGLIFTGLWIYALVKGHEVDQIRAARLRE
jgi:hypothetical protein